MKRLPFAGPLFVVLLLPAFAVAAQDASTSAPASGTPARGDGTDMPKAQPPGGRDCDVDAALSARAQAQSLSEDPRADMVKTDACMSAKDFRKPQAGPARDGNGATPPPQSDAS